MTKENPQTDYNLHLNKGNGTKGGDRNNTQF